MPKCAHRAAVTILEQLLSSREFLQGPEGNVPELPCFRFQYFTFGVFIYLFLLPFLDHFSSLVQWELTLRRLGSPHNPFTQLVQDLLHWMSSDLTLFPAPCLGSANIPFIEAYNLPPPSTEICLTLGLVEHLKARGQVELNDTFSLSLFLS